MGDSELLNSVAAIIESGHLPNDECARALRKLASRLDSATPVSVEERLRSMVRNMPDSDGFKRYESSDWLRTVAAEMPPDDKVKADKVSEIADDLEVLEATLDLCWEADARAREMWQKATGKTLIWPDSAKLSVWLMQELEKRGGL